MRFHTDDRAAIQLVDVLMTFILVVALMVLAPIFYKFTSMVSASADPFASLLLQAALPLLFIALLLSVGQSATRGGG